MEITENGEGSVASLKTKFLYLIPKFDPSNKLYQKLSSLSKNAHYAASIGDEAGLRELEEGIDEDAAQIWGLTKEELKKIQTSLAELV